MQKALKNYQPPEIINTIKEYATVELDLGESIKELKPKEVINIKYKVHGSLNVHLIGNFKRNVDIREAISFLREKEYLVEYCEISYLSTYAFVFAKPNQLKNLKRHG